MEYPIPTFDSYPTAITSGPDGNLWFTEVGGNQIGMINPTTHAINEFPIPTPSSAPYGITSGPDGNLWFTESNSNEIGMIDPATGAISEFPTPTPNSEPESIALGPDRNLWFTEESNLANRIGMINPTTHAISEFPIPTPFSGAGGIAAGSDGNLWFTELNGNKIGEINPATGAITEFLIPTPSAGPLGITGGKDGNLWFTELQAPGDSIGTINPATGAISEFPIPTSASQPYGITSGPDGKLWFTEDAASQIGAIDPTTHAFSEFPTPTANSLPLGITAGPDGDIWFTEAYGNRIGSVNSNGIAVVSGNNQSAAINTPFAAPLVVRVTDQAGNPISGLAVTFAAPASGAGGTFSNGSNTITAATDANGQVSEAFTADSKAGAYSVTASVPATGMSAVFALTNNTGAPSTVTSISGDGQNGAINSTFPNPLIATVTDQFGNPVPNVAVAFAAPASGAGGTFSNGSNTITATTDANGQVSEVFTANSKQGSYSVTASVAGVAAPAAFKLRNTPTSTAFQVSAPNSTTIIVTYPQDGIVETYTSLTPFNNITLADLDGRPGNEILLSYALTINGIPTNFPTVTVIFPLENTVSTYNIGYWTDFILGEVNGQPGTDVVFHQIGPLAPATSVTVLMEQSGALTTSTYGSLTPYNNLQLVDLDGRPGNEILLTYRLTINGIPTNIPTVTVVTPRLNTARAYNVGYWTDFILGEVNGQPGTDVVFHQIGPLAPATSVTVLMEQSGALTTSTYGSLTPYNNLQLVDIDGQAGDEILLTYRLTIDGIPENGQIVTVVTSRLNTARAYNVGYWTDFILGEVNGQPGTDLVFHQLGAIFPGNQVTVLMQRSGTITAFSYASLASYNNIQLVDLDGRSGDEILLTYQAILNGFFANGQTVTVITPRLNTVRAYNIGFWTDIRIGEVNGQAGDDVVFDDERAFFGGHQVTVLMQQSGTVTAFPYASLTTFNNVTLDDLDGKPGDEILLTYQEIVNGFPANGQTVTVITPRLNAVRTFNVGHWTSFRPQNVDGQPGDEVLFYTGSLVTATLNDRKGTVTFP